MKYGVREICDVVLKAKAKMTVGNKVFYKDEPVIYFDSLKTSSLEGAATTVYAQGGRGNTRLIAWEGERTVTFTMEDALISSIGLSILSGAEVYDAAEKTIVQHLTENTDKIDASGNIYVKNAPYVKSKLNGSAYEVDNSESFIYVMKLDSQGNITTEPYLYEVATGTVTFDNTTGKATVSPVAEKDSPYEGLYKITLKTTNYSADSNKPTSKDVVLVDYYTLRTAGAQQIEITPDKFGGNFYLEASTLFKDTNGVDLPAEFIIPNCKVQSNFTFTMASSGDPSTFTFTMDAFPDYTRFDKTKKVLSVIQVIGGSGSGSDEKRIATDDSYVKPAGGGSGT